MQWRDTFSLEERRAFWSDCETRLRTIIALADETFSVQCPEVWYLANQFLDHNENGLALDQITAVISARGQAVTAELLENLRVVAAIMGATLKPLTGTSS